MEELKKKIAFYHTGKVQIHSDTIRKWQFVMSHYDVTKINGFRRSNSNYKFDIHSILYYNLCLHY